MPPRPAPDTPFTEEDLARLPQWAQRKVTWLSGQLARALESFDDKQLAALAEDLHITPEQINRAHLEALAIADSLQFS